ncbi:lipoprotein ABC transporter permease [Galbitalea sp. SE-J8]|uniref:FtsX-like permease family protein n=1 Tax=Galbitalea sp. SE-J8 TaxID=3054952 RepID=UPI00259D1E3F|nr:FtsX-like permease family protein [Galbitalea sp. SE-J8]MDM4764143.1 lipoprotein ABC transporter permease [Galbitalea sp. SE-J8]
MSWQIAALVRESLASAWSQRVASVVTIVMIAGMCAAVLLTTGRTVGAEDAVLRSIDSAGTRAIVISADAAAGLDSTVLDRIAHLDGIQWAAAFGSVTDVTNAAFPDGTPVPTRNVWGSELDDLGIGTSVDPGSTAWASEDALGELGLIEPAGGAVSETGGDIAVVGKLNLPDYLSFLEPAVFIPEPASRVGPVSILVVIASRPDLVEPVAAATKSVLAVDDPTAVSMKTSAALAALRAAVEGQLGQFGRTLVLLICGLTGVLVAAILFGLVMLRRRDYGRRRALGATRSLIVTVVLVQTAAPAVVGAAVGSLAGTISIAALGDPAPDLDFIVAIGVFAIAVAVIAALLPALVAARREPIRELRVP